ncbi:MAG: hypothetical protein ACI4GZ_04755 [Ruminococcus sp.]
MMKPETKFDFAKIQAAILTYDKTFAAFDEAYAAFDTAYTGLKEFTDNAKERLRQQRERNHARIHELELLLVVSPSQQLRDIEAKIKIRREKLNANWATYAPGHQRAIDELEAERKRLVEEIRRTPATPEEIELKELKAIKYVFTSDEKEEIQRLYDVAMHEYNELYLAKEHLLNRQKETTKAIEQCRFELLRMPLLEMGRRYVDNIKTEADSLCEEV